MSVHLLGSGLSSNGAPDLAAAAALQLALRDRIVARDDFGAPETVAGVDVAWDRSGRRGWAATAVWRLADLRPIAAALAEAVTDFPYVPGLLAWRELPAMLAALASLDRPPDLILCDGHGMAHPRRFGLACHLGLATGLPTIGVAKALLVGEHTGPGAARGDWTPLRAGDEIVGAALRTQPRARPVYVSIGHRISLASCIALVLHCAPRFRLPEPLRAAHQLARTKVGARGDCPLGMLLRFD